MSNSSPATASTDAQRTASLPMTTLRGPNRSAITPPPSISTRARHRADRHHETGLRVAVPAWTAAQDRAM